MKVSYHESNYVVEKQSKSEMNNVNNSHNNTISSTIEPSKTSRTCMVCCEECYTFGIYPCDHNLLCWKCALTQRELMKDIRCYICKQENKIIIISSAHHLHFSDFNLKSLLFLKDLQLYVDSKDLFQKIEQLQSLRCIPCLSSHQNTENQQYSGKTPDNHHHHQVHNRTFPSLEDLKKHLFFKHSLSYCDLCLSKRKVLFNDQKLYTQKQLMIHQKFGEIDPNVGVIKPHPICRFCQIRFYDDDEIFSHMTQCHEECFLCKMKKVFFEYHRDYPALEKHFHEAHHACMDSECLSLRFVVFSSALDLKAHQALVHGKNSRGGGGGGGGGGTTKIDLVLLQKDAEERENKIMENRRQIRMGECDASAIRFCSCGGDEYNATIEQQFEIPEDLREYQETLEKKMLDLKIERQKNRIASQKNQASSALLSSSSSFSLNGKGSSSSSGSSSSGSSSSSSSGSSSTIRHNEMNKKERNEKLIQKMKALLQNDDKKFGRFKKLSSQYQRGEIHVDEYYQYFQSLFGGDDQKVEQIVYDMIELMPEKNQAQAIELKKVHETYVKNREKMKKFQDEWPSLEEQEVKNNTSNTIQKQETLLLLASSNFGNGRNISSKNTYANISVKNDMDNNSKSKQKKNKPNQNKTGIDVIATFSNGIGKKKGIKSSPIKKNDEQ